MQAEVLFDAVTQVTNAPTTFPGLPGDRYSPRRAIMLPDESFASYFLDVFGRPRRISARDCWRGADANLGASLDVLDPPESQREPSRPGARADQLARDPRSDREKVAELFLWAFARRPSENQMRLSMENITLNGSNKRLAYENIIWALMNSKEFIFIQ